MDQVESSTANTTADTGNVSQQNSLDHEDRLDESKSFVKVNGDHNMPQQIFPSDEESTTSSASSSSSPRNLIIDHQDDNSKDAHDEKKAKEIVASKPTQDTETSSKTDNGGTKGSNKRKITMKRKLSLRDMRNPDLPVKRRMSAKSVDLSVPEKSVDDPPVRDDRRESEGCRPNSDAPLILRLQKSIGPFREYAHYLGLKPSTIPIKCFKCSNSNFDNLNQLRDHQKICLFKDKQRSLSCAADSKCIGDSLRSVDKASKEQHNNSIDLSKALENAKQKEVVGAPGSNTTAKAKKRVFLCSACGTYYENWNLFLHMREVHKRHICLYCIGMFPSAERLTFHLEMKHDLEQNHYDCQERLLKSSRDSCYLMCCACEYLFTEHDDFSDHKCADHLQPCSICGQKGKHSANCKLASSQSSKTRHKDNNKRKNKPICGDKKISLKQDLALKKPAEGMVNGGSSNSHESSILRNIISGGDRHYPKNETSAISSSSPLKLNGCEEATANVVETHKVEDTHKVEEQNNDHDSASSKELGTVITCIGDIPENEENAFPRESADVERVEQTNESEDTPLSQSNTTTYPTSHSHSTPEDLDDSQRSSDAAPVDMPTSESKPLLVPKFKIRIPKEFQTPLESEQSSTESEENEGERSENAEEEQSEGSDMDLEEIQTGNGVEKSYGMNESETKEGDDKNTEMSESQEVVLDKTLSTENSTLSSSPPKTESKDESMSEPMEQSLSTEEPKSEDKTEPEFVEADEDVPLQELLLDQPLDRIDMVDFMRICLRNTCKICLYCNHARRIAVNGQSFVQHLISQHRFSATVDSITAEELQPSTILQKLKNFVPDSENIFFNLETYSNSNKENLKPYEKIFECFQCRFETRIHKELYLHNRKMHLKNAILCFMCRSNFFSYSEILCHMCPGAANKSVIFEMKFRCCLCDIDNIPSAFRLMVHLRKKHFACDVCLEDCFDQSRLSSHVWKHKLHHLCYRCGIAYRNKPDITKHLFWKHGTESVLCKRCLQKRWPHVYHFCVPPTAFVCEVCNLSFSRAMALKVHKRLHTGDAPYPCPEDDCEQKFISRKLLLKHTARHNESLAPPPPIVDEEHKDESLEQSNNESSATSQEKEDTQEISVEKQEDVKVEETNGQSKKKRKRSKKPKDLDDLMDLPAPNLSESDSSDESDDDKSKSEKVETPVPNVMLSPPSEADEEDTGNNSGTQIMDIWENFKSFQASQVKTDEDDNPEENDDAPAPPILHVAQSDHDYCLVFKPINKLTKSSSKDDLTEIRAENEEKKTEHASPKKKQKSPRKQQKSGSESSSSGSSSSSDSSCSCGSNCSCSSSSGSSSGSSSSSDSESSSSEGKRRSAARRAAKHERKNRSKSEAPKAEDAEMLSPKANTSDIVDVVTTDTKSQEIIDPDSIILESDLETDESETDEDFYDEHPQKMANQSLAEKRKQLMQQTSLSPSHNFDFIENSRPSTPSIPEEMVKEKKVKIKKKKRDKKVSKNDVVPAFSTDDPAPHMVTVEHSLIKEIQTNTPDLLAPTPTSLLIPESLEGTQHKIDAMSTLGRTQQRSSTPIPAPISAENRLSTGSSSDADASLKRSKRRRRPNKFYGYSSDDEMAASSSLISGSTIFKPTPPPNLTWRKEDLPAPAKVSSHKHKSSATHAKKSTPANTPPLPPIPPIIIRPSALLSKRPMSIENAPHKPPIVQPIRVPAVPVHHIRPPQYISPNQSVDESDSSSDDDHRLTIMTTAVRKKGGHGSKQQRSNNQQRSNHQQRQQQQAQRVPNSSQQQPHQQPQQESQPQAQPEAQQGSSAGIDVKRIPPALLPNPDAARLEYFRRNKIRYPIQPPAGARPPREGESVYCYCRCPYDEVSEMIACDGDDCMIEWFHFECVGILVPPQGKWFCPECRSLYPNEASSLMENT